jgi:hypothetical protein
VFGRPHDVEGQCNAWLTIPDDYGDNEATCRCQLPAGHEGPHGEQFIRGPGMNHVVITWEVDMRPGVERQEEIERGRDAVHCAEGPEEPGEDYLAAYCDEMAAWDEDEAEEAAASPTPQATE